MKETVNHSKKDSISNVIGIVISLGILFILFFLDEGTYSTKWVSNPGVWVVFGIYAVIMAFGFAAGKAIIFRTYEGKYIPFLRNVLSILFGILLLFSIFYLIE